MDDGNATMPATHDMDDQVPVATPVASTGFDADDSEALIALKNLEEKRKRKRRSRAIKVGVCAALIAAGIGIWAFMNAQANEDSLEESGPETAIAMREDFSTSISASGSLQPASSVVVTPEVDGTIQEVMTSEGSYVEEGDVLFTMRSPELEKAVNTAAKGVDEAADGVRSARAAVSSMQKAYSKAKKTYKAQKAKADAAIAKAEEKGGLAYEKAYDKVYAAEIAKIPADATENQRSKLEKAADKAAKEAGQEAYDKAYATVKIPEVDPFDDASYVEQISSAKSEVTSAQSTLDSAQQDYNEAVAELDKCTVRAPQAGTVLSLDAVVGAGVGDGESGPTGSLAQIADLSRMKVNVEVNEIDISNIEKGQRANVTFSAFPDLELEAKVADIGSVASGSEEGDFGGGGVVTFKVDLVIDKPDPRLKLGMTASVDILTQDIPNALVIPAAALTDDGDGNYTVDVVVNEETLETKTKTVKVAAQSSSEAVIKKGLNEGDMVLVYGSDGGDMDDMDDGELMEGFEG